MREIQDLTYFLKSNLRSDILRLIWGEMVKKKRVFEFKSEGLGPRDGSPTPIAHGSVGAETTLPPRAWFAFESRHYSLSSRQ